MEYNKLIAELHTGDDVEGFYVLKDAFLKTTAAGKPFLSGVLADRSGVIDLKVWDYSGRFGNLLGQVCPLYTGLWFLLCIPVYGLAGLVRKLLARM